MSTADAEFWKFIEKRMECTIPSYLKNLLRLSGFDNVSTIKTLTNEDYKSLETFARKKLKKFIPSRANLMDYYHLFSEEPESFEIIPGHVRLLNQIVRLTNDEVELCQSPKKDENLKDEQDEQPQSQPETVKAFIVDGSPDAFYIQMESSSGELDQLLVSLESASTWPVLDEVAVGQMCAALFDGAYYRAKIFSLSSEGVTVHYTDYGNQSLSTDLRKLPENLHSVKHLAISCALKSKKGIFSPQTIESFASLSKEDVYVFKYVSKESSPAIVELFLQDGTKFEEKSATEIPASTANVKVKAYISERIGPNHFYIQLNNDMEEAMVTANEFPLLEDSCKCAGQRCAAFWEEAFYRAEILAVDDTGIKVHFIDYGNESYATDLRKLPENLEKIERASMLCKLYSENDRFSSDLVAKFIGLDLDQEYEFEMKTQSSPCIVRLYVNGELFSDGQSVSDMPKNSHIEANSDSIAIVKEVESSNERRVVVKENSLNGMDAIDISSYSTDTATEITPPTEYDGMDEYNEQFDNIAESNRQFDDIIESMTKLVEENLPYEMPKFIEPAVLNDGDFVVVRYVESPKSFFVQKTINIVAYDAMMDKLCQYCNMSAPSLNKFQIGMACAARFKNDSEWYRSVILKVNTNKALIEFVDFGIAITIDVDQLKEIGVEFLKMPTQAVRSCLLGFEALELTTNSSHDLMEFLAEKSSGERRNFRVKIHGHVNDTILLNLTDESEVPRLDLSMRALQLSLPQNKFREFRSKTVDRPNEIDSQLNSRSNTKYSGSGTISNGTANVQQYAEYQISNRSNSNSPGKPDHFKGSPSHNSIDQLKRREPPLPNTQVPTETLSINRSESVRLVYCYSPLEFFVTTTKSDADLEYTMQMKTIYHFYKNKSPMAGKAAIGSFVIAKYDEDKNLYRGKIVDFNNKSNTYMVRLIDVGALTKVHASGVYEMDNRFTNLECQAIKCSLDGVALRKNPFDMQNAIEKLMIDRTMLCKFIRKTADTFYVDIEVDRTNVQEMLIREKYLSILARDVDIERLVGQTVMARIVSVREFSSFQIVISGCETIFEASSPVSNINPIPDFKKLPINIAIPIRIDKLLIGKTFAVTPLIEMFGQTPPSPICNLPFFSDNFKAIVVHWESYNVAYVQSATAQNLSESLLNELFEFYDKSGETLHEFVPQTLCAAKSADDNWYRAEILSETTAEVKVRYLDYGNCESIPKGLVKRLESKFCTTAVLAVKVFLPLGKVYSDREMSVDEIVNLTADVSLDLRVLAFHADNWIVDLLKDDNSITSTIKTKNCCKTMNLDELKRHIADIEVVRKATKLQCQKERANSQAKAAAVPIVKEQSQPQKPPASQNIQPSSAPQNTQLDKKVSQNTQPDKKAAPSETTSKTKAFISHIDRPDRFYLQVSSITDYLNRLQEDIQIVAPSLPALDDFSTDTRCIVRYSVDDQWYRAAIIDSDTKITSILFIDYGNTDTIDDNSLIKSTNYDFDRMPGFAIPCALPLEAKDRIEWSNESCELLKSLVDTELEFEYVCKGKFNNFVKLYHGERDIMQEVIQKGHAIEMDFSNSKSTSVCYNRIGNDTDALEKVGDYLLDDSKSIVDLFLDEKLTKIDEKGILEEIHDICADNLSSRRKTTFPGEPFMAFIVEGDPSQFYIQLERDASKLDQLWVSLESAFTWPVLEEVVVGQMCAALFDGVYYRAKILFLSDHGATVHYVDYGNQASSTHLKKLPENLQNLKHLAINCTLEGRNGRFSPQIQESFANLSKDIAYEMRFVSEWSSPAIVRLFVNGVQFEE